MVFGLFGKKDEPYNRSKIMEAAQTALTKGNKKKALEEFKKVITMDEGDYDAHAKAAPLFAELGQMKEAWMSFKKAADYFLKKGFHDKAVGLYSQAVRFMPDKRHIWEEIAALHIAKNKKSDAIDVLFKGSLNFRKNGQKSDAIMMLKQAWEIKPWDFRVGMDMGYLLLDERKSGEAKNIFNGLAEREKGANKRKARWGVFKTDSSAGNFFRWAKAFVGS